MSGDGNIDIATTGMIVTRVCLDPDQFLPLVDDDRGTMELKLAGPMRVSGPGGEHAVDPEAIDARLMTIMGLMRQRVSGCAASRTGELHLAFGDGTRVTVSPADDYEAWDLDFPGRIKIVCMPGGELAVWDPY